MARLALHLLGGFALRVDTRPRSLPAKKAQALLAFLALRARLHELALEALRRLMRHHVKAGRLDQAVPIAVRLVALDPLQEDQQRALMRLHLRQGRRAAALRQYQECVAVLQRELGVEPEPETKRLYLEILQHANPGTVRAARPSLPAHDAA